MAKEIKVIIFDLECPDAPLQGEPIAGTSVSKEVEKILEAGCIANGKTFSRPKADSLLSYSCADIVFEVKSLEG